MRRAGALAVLGAAAMMLTSCSTSTVEPWDSAALVSSGSFGSGAPDHAGVDQAPAGSASVPIPAVYRVLFSGTVSEGSKSLRFQVGGWLLVTGPYDAVGGSLNDVNLYDFGLKTDTSPLQGFSGALWFGTNTSIQGDMNLGMILTGADGDIVTEHQQDGTIFAEVIRGVSPLNTFNIYNVDQGVTAQINNILEGTLAVRFSPDGSAMSATIDLGGTSGMGGPTVSSRYHAEIQGQRTA